MSFKIRRNELRKYIPEDGETKIIIPEGVKNILNNVFSFLPDITDVVFPESLRSIGIKAFYRCTGLTDINLPFGVKKINDRSFSETELNNISIPDSVEYIHYNAFGNHNPKNLTLKGRNIQVKIPLLRSIRDNVFRYDGKDNIFNFIGGDLSEKENMLTQELFTKEFFIYLVIFIALEYDSETGWELIKKNKVAAMQCIVTNTYENNDAVITFLEKGIFTEAEIDELIQYVNRIGRYELQIIISRFRQDNFGSAFDSFDKFFI